MDIMNDTNANTNTITNSNSNSNTYTNSVRWKNKTNNDFKMINLND